MGTNHMKVIYPSKWMEDKTNPKPEPRDNKLKEWMEKKIFDEQKNLKPEYKKIVTLNKEAALVEIKKNFPNDWSTPRDNDLKDTVEFTNWIRREIEASVKKEQGTIPSTKSSPPTMAVTGITKKFPKYVKGKTAGWSIEDKNPLRIKYMDKDGLFQKDEAIKKI